MSSGPELTPYQERVRAALGDYNKKRGIGQSTIERRYAVYRGTDRVGAIMAANEPTALRRAWARYSEPTTDGLSNPFTVRQMDALYNEKE